MMELKQVKYTNFKVSIYMTAVTVLIAKQDKSLEERTGVPRIML
jgi:hypothetical protein